ncbi:MAG: DUF86 domain-containing protein [Candidatus Latescibacterota bacterium]|nr:MAG: DUF86 domain-containing protein [Candidatus Latescibacterota bacterium]
MKQKREVLDYLRDILDMMEKVQEFTQGMDLQNFVQDAKTAFAVIRALEVIGEATKHVPTAVRQRYPDIPWKRMAGMRDRLIHGYFGVDMEIVWKTAVHLIPELRPQIARVIEVERKRRNR